MSSLITLENFYEQLKQKHDVPGTLIALAKNGEKIYEQSIGYRDLEKQLPVTENTVFGLASITKSFTCAAIMHLQENGLLDVHDKVKKYLPEFRLYNDDRTDQINIHHFMTHSSGFPPLFALEYAMKRRQLKKPKVYSHVGTNKQQSILNTYSELMDYIAQQKTQLYASPGKQFSYSNEAYSLLGAIIERVSGQSYESYLYNNILDPLGMKHTRFTMRELSDHPDKTKSFGKKDGSDDGVIITDDFWTTSSSMQATGFLKSTANNMLKYAELYLNKGNVNGREILSEQSVSEMIKPQMKVNRNEYYGYGFRIIPDYYGKTFIGHGGSLRSVSSRFGMIPENKMAGIVLANLIGFPASRVLDHGFKEYLGVDTSKTLYNYKAFDVSKSKLNTYLGEYASNEGAKLELKLIDNEIILQGKENDYQTKFISDTEFIIYSNGYEDLLEILLDDNDKPYALLFGSRVVNKIS